MTYRLDWLPAAELRLDDMAQEEGQRVDAWLMDLVEAPHRPPGTRVPGYEPPVFAAVVPNTEVVVTFVVFHASSTVRVLWLETLRDLLG